MQQHINNGCEKCSSTVRVWQSVSTIAAVESALTPPANAVRVVKSQFAAVMPSTSGVRLVFDSILQPLTAGTRGSAVARQFLYETDDYYIDLRLEPVEADRTCLMGQVLNRAGADPNAPGLAVRLQEGTNPIAHTSTNEFGEFQLEFAAAEGLWVAISRSKAADIILPLYGIRLNTLTDKDLN